MVTTFIKQTAMAAVLGFLALPAMAQEENWVRPCDVFEAFQSAGRVTSDKAIMYKKMCEVLGNDVVAESCLELSAIDEGARPKPGRDEEDTLNAACDAAIVAGVPAALRDLATSEIVVTEDSAVAPETSDMALELAFWESVKDSEETGLLLAYLQRFPNGAFREIAAAKIAALSTVEEGEKDTVSSQPQTVIVERPVVVSPPKSTGTDIARVVQRQLARVGCYRGAIDGIWGSGSSAAIRRFNRATGRSLNDGGANARQVTIIKQYGRVCR